MIWTRRQRSPDQTPQMRKWLASSGFDEIPFDVPGTAALAIVGVNRLRRAPARALPDHRLFIFLERIAADPGGGQS